MNRREFLKIGALAAAGAPLGAKAWDKPMPFLDPSEDWMTQDWEDAYVWKDFIFVKPSVQPIGDGQVALQWVTREMATSWAEVSQDGGRTWTRIWGERDGIRDVFTRRHLAVVENYDLTRALKYRVVARPISEASQWGNVRYAGENLAPGSLQGYYIKAKEYKELVRRRKESGYEGEAYTAEGEIAAIAPSGFDVAMVNDVHHNIPFYPDFLKCMSDKTALAVFAGDICDHARSPDDFDKHLMAPMAYLSMHRHCLVKYVRGNHETMGPYARNVRDHIALENDAFYGAMTIGETRLVFLDTGNVGADDEFSWTQFYYGMDHYFRREIAWLRDETASSAWKGARYRIAFAHIPPERQTRVNWLYDVLNGANLSLLMAGHEHYAHFEPSRGGTPYPLVIGGGPTRDHGKRGEPIATVSTLSVRPEGLSVVQTGIDGKEIFREKIG